MAKAANKPAKARERDGKAGGKKQQEDNDKKVEVEKEMMYRIVGVYHSVYVYEVNPSTRGG